MSPKRMKVLKRLKRARATKRMKSPQIYAGAATHVSGCAAFRGPRQRPCLVGDDHRCRSQYTHGLAAAERKSHHRSGEPIPSVAGQTLGGIGRATNGWSSRLCGPSPVSRPREDRAYAEGHGIREATQLLNSKVGSYPWWAWKSSFSWRPQRAEASHQ